MVTQPSSTPPEFVFDYRTSESGHKKLYFPAISFSDIHLGTHASRAKRLCKLMDHLAVENMFLVGDIIDGVSIRHKNTFHFGGPWHRQVLGHIFRAAATGTHVTYILGNHDHVGTGKEIPHPETPDSFLHHRKLVGKAVKGVTIAEQVIYTNPQGDNIHFSHGHEAESTPDIWYHIGDVMIYAMQDLDRWMQNKFPSLREHSIAAVVKRAFKTIYLPLMNVFENMERRMEAENIHKKVFGHSHVAGIKHTKSGRLIMNDGCCTEHVQFWAQDRNGTNAVITMHADYLKIQDEYGREYIKTWDDLGLSDRMKEAPQVHHDDHTRTAQHIERLIYRAYPSRDRRMMAAEIKRRNQMTRDFNPRNDPLEDLEEQALAVHLEELGKLRESYRHIPVPRPDYPKKSPN